MQLKQLALLGTLLVAGVLSFGAEAADPITVEFWAHEHPPRAPFDKRMIAAFEKANPGIKINETLLPHEELATKLLTSFATGAAPDLFNFHTMAVGQYHVAGLLAPLDLEAAGFADYGDLQKHFLQGSLNGITFGDKVYGLPTEVSDYYCYANNAYWAEKGLNPKTDYPKTWEEMVNVAEKLTVRDGSGVPTRRGFDFNWVGGSYYMWLQFDPMVRQLGHKMIDETTYTASINKPEVARVFQFWSDWANAHRLGGPQYPENRPAFLGGQSATDCAIGIWGVPLLKEAKIEFTPFPAPRWSDALSDNGMGNYAYYLMVSSQSSQEVQSAAWKFARFYSKHQAEMFAEAGLFVPTPELVASDAAKATPGMDLYLSEFSKSFFTPRIAGFTEVGDALLRARDKIVQGDEKTEAVLPALEQEVNGILAREKLNAEALK